MSALHGHCRVCAVPWPCEFMEEFNEALMEAVRSLE